MQTKVPRRSVEEVGCGLNARVALPCFVCMQVLLVAAAACIFHASFKARSQEPCNARFGPRLISKAEDVLRRSHLSLAKVHPFNPAVLLSAV